MGRADIDFSYNTDCSQKDGLGLFIKTTEEVYLQAFSDYLKTIADKLQATSQMYYAFGFGKLDLSGLNEQGGIAKAISSYYVTA